MNARLPITGMSQSSHFLADSGLVVQSLAPGFPVTVAHSAREIIACFDAERGENCVVGCFLKALKDGDLG
jgi:hypothetical protein